MMTEDDILRLMTSGESQTLEFKESLGRGAQAEGTQSLVAFANRDGGKVLFGVADDGTLRGVTVGAATLENLTNFITSHTYPSLPVHIESVKIAGRSVVVAEAPSDRPPVIGVYLYSGRPIQPNESVGAGALQAYRRVGRTNQKEDFMRLREGRDTDPRLRIEVIQAERYVHPDSDASGLSFVGRVWVEEPSGGAHNVRFCIDRLGTESNDRCPDLPHPNIEMFTFGFRIEPPPDPVPDAVAVSAIYEDDWGITWQSTRVTELKERPVEGRDYPRVGLEAGRFHRRIVRFPSKAAGAVVP